MITRICDKCGMQVKSLGDYHGYELCHTCYDSACAALDQFEIKQSEERKKFIQDYMAEGRPMVPTEQL